MYGFPLWYQTLYGLIVVVVLVQHYLDCSWPEALVRGVVGAVLGVAGFWVLYTVLVWVLWRGTA